MGAVTISDLTPYEAKSLRGLRGIGAGILTLEALVVALAIPVVLDQGHGSHTLRHIAVAAAAVVAVLLIVAGAELRRPWGPRFATGVQVLAVVVSASSWTFLFLTVLFGAIWVGWLFMLRTLHREHAAARDNQDADVSV
ncbi:hypothetical protein acdb102_34240 [Acidothermaceae bacterium B102]|nr:hypothetical protein acdb102_34240 [Acidothermaceae bacterium B102]